MKVAILILAAGKSARMGQPKQLLPWGDTTLLGHAIGVANCSKADKVFVVLGAEAEKIGVALQTSPYIPILNREWEKGMGTSISVGLRHILATGYFPDALLLMVGDQPYVDAEYVNELIDAYAVGKASIVATQYPSKLGVPAIFNNSYFDELQVLQGEKGAGPLMKKYKKECWGLNAGKKVLDLDTIADYKKYKPENH